MNVTREFQALVQSLGRIDTSGSSPARQDQLAALTEDSAFQDLLLQEFERNQLVVSSAEILADLDGSPTFDYEGLSMSPQMASRGTTATTSSGKQADTIGQSGIMEKIERIAASYGVDANLVREVVRAESNFNPNAVSRAGAKGLMQLMDSTARSLQVKNSFDPEQNIQGGTKYLRDLMRRYDGNVKVALAAYNAGPGRVDRLDIDTDAEFEAKAAQLPKETQAYVDKITSRLNG